MCCEIIPLQQINIIIYLPDNDAVSLSISEHFISGEHLSIISFITLMRDNQEKSATTSVGIPTISASVDNITKFIYLSPVIFLHNLVLPPRNPGENLHYEAMLARLKIF